MSNSAKDLNHHSNADVDQNRDATDENMHLPHGATGTTDGNQLFKAPDDTDLGTVTWFPGLLPPVLERKDPQAAAPATAAVPVGSRYLLQDAAEMDIDTITWQSGTTVRITFNGGPSLPSTNDFIHITTATSSSNNGSFIVTAVSGFVEYTNAARTDGIDDEATDSPAVAKWTDDTWGSDATPNAWTEVDKVGDTWRAVEAQEGNQVYNMDTSSFWIFDGSIWTLVNKIATGSYTGDGAESLAVTGIGFTPKYVKIWQKAADNASISIVEATAEILDDDGAGMAAVHAAGAAEHTVQNNTIIAFGTDGFTVDDNGADNHPNENGTDYNYLALG